MTTTKASSGYDRDSFELPRTTDVDGNGCDVRDDVACCDSRTSPQYADSVWSSPAHYDPHTAQTIHFVRTRHQRQSVQIDHVVALKTLYNPVSARLVHRQTP